MASNRTIEALRRLAERPGTVAEGLLARETLKRLTFDPGQPIPRSLEDILRAADSAPMTREELECVRVMEEERLAKIARAERQRQQDEKRATYLAWVKSLEKGDRVFFNYGRYSDPGIISTPVDQHLDLKVKLDRLIWPKKINVFHGGTQCLSKDQIVP
jgi:hypothetical protein